MGEHTREHLAWLIYCMSQGYVKAEDRAILTNWLLKDPAMLHPDDAELRPHLLAMADEVLASTGGEGRLSELGGVLHGWPMWRGVTCVECPGCGFTFDADHQDTEGGYSCSVCEVERLREAIATAVELLDSGAWWRDVVATLRQALDGGRA